MGDKLSEKEALYIKTNSRSSDWKNECLNCLLRSLSLIVSTVIAFFILYSWVIPHKSNSWEENGCSIRLVESIPENLTFGEKAPFFLSTYDGWSQLLNRTEKSLDLAVFYWTLKNEDVSPKHFQSSWQGEDIFDGLLRLGKTADVKVRIAQNFPTKSSPQHESKYLQEQGAAEVRSVNFDALVGAGILHTKMWISDGKHMYVGSANMDWRSLTQVKETGLLIQDCPCLVQDAQKIFEVYWYLGGAESIPATWPKELWTNHNLEFPVSLNISGRKHYAALSSSPPPFNPPGRTNDVDAILHAINSAEKFIYIAVMDYFPRFIYSDPHFWPKIDNALRKAALERRVTVRILGSHWKHTRKDMVRWLRSLSDLSGPYPRITIETKLFVVPSFTEEQKSVPFGRVNHNKYMVTDKVAYVGTSNWSADYFVFTGGVGLSIWSRENVTCSSGDAASAEGADIRCQLKSIFDRDWNSVYAKPVEKSVEEPPDLE